MELVFTDKNEAFKMLKRCRESRLKCFPTYEEAEIFAQYGKESQSTIDVILTANGITSPVNNCNNNCDKNGSKGEIFIISLEFI